MNKKWPHFNIQKIINYLVNTDFIFSKKSSGPIYSTPFKSRRSFPSLRLAPLREMAAGRRWLM